MKLAKLFPFPLTGEGPRAARARRWLAYGASVGLLTLCASSAFAVFPFLTGVPPETGVYRAEGTEFTLRSGEEILVYDVVGPSKTRRGGAAAVDGDRMVRLTRYDGDTNPKRSGEAVLMAANIRTLWVLASDSERAELREAMNEFGTAAGRAFQSTLTSPEFEAEYRPLIITAIKRAAGEAWKAPETRAAVAELLRVGKPVLRHLTADTIRPVVMERLQPALWATVKDNTARLLDIFDGFQFDFRQIEAALMAAATDERVWRESEDALGVLAGTPQNRALIETFVGVFARELVADATLVDTISRALSDGRLARYLEAMGEPGLRLARTAPRALAQLDENADLNSLAADIFKSQARGQSGHVIVFMPSALRHRIETIDPLAAMTLVWESTP